MHTTSHPAHKSSALNPNSRLYTHIHTRADREATMGSEAEESSSAQQRPEGESAEGQQEQQQQQDEEVCDECYVTRGVGAWVAGWLMCTPPHIRTYARDRNFTHRRLPWRRR
jgi:hypothetical protein